jgi:hypothetical protein
MIEDVWRSGDLGFLSRRPFFAFVLTAGERLWTEVGGEALRPTIELAWRRAEREAPDEEVERHREEMRAIYQGAVAVSNWQLARLVNVLALLFKEPGSAARTLVFPHPMSDPGQPRAPLLSPVELKNCCRLMREFFNPQWGPLPSQAAWRTDTVVALARQMYDSRDFRAMPILADALQDAGCDNDEVLNHCRAGAVHFRGCWVVDLVLGKE